MESIPAVMHQSMWKLIGVSVAVGVAAAATSYFGGKILFNSTTVTLREEQ